VKKYYVTYVENSSDKLAEFDTKTQCEAFLTEFIKVVDEPNGYWVQHIFYGEKIDMTLYAKLPDSEAT